MTNIIEQSMIINHLTQPQKQNNPKQSSLQSNQISLNSKNTQSWQSSKANIFDIQNHNMAIQQDQENVTNILISSGDLSQADVKENDIKFDGKQILNKVNHKQPFSQQDLFEIQTANQEKLSPQLIVMNTDNTTHHQIDKHKQVMLQIGNKNQNQNIQQTVQIVEQQAIQEEVVKPKPLDKQMIGNLKEIFQFYSKQSITANKYNTFEKLLQLSNIMILQKFMFFCKDFEIIDLEITNDLILKLGGKLDIIINKHKNQFKFNHKQNFIVTKFNLVEIYKKNANPQMELKYENFQMVIIKLAQITFPEQNDLFYNYLGLIDPKQYRRKMQLIGKPFNSKEHSEILTQEKLYERKIFLLPKPNARFESVKKERHTVEIHFPRVNLTERCRMKQKKNETVQKDASYINWDDLDDLQQQFDPKQFILEQDLGDKEDDYYLQEYAKHGQNVKAKIQNQIIKLKELFVQTPQISLESNNLSANHNKRKNNMLTTEVTRHSNNKSIDLYDISQKKKSLGQSPQNIELTNLEKQNQIYRIFLNQQSFKEKMVNKKNQF
ncbi:unnamed protein product (macronuclear) [Paramecium tetraurelia]|uniref:Uncharacterized protein n=1 Tax=Paramecium tetraurelia TaxID=5888 RepID=A0CSS9_PARTE|nr:uncharacterized protein GSPATT00010118001 [Paramecium tetraurelia]CAK73846.1 unnamed protein product [Paramecium tetraurelia]|eukprot:XP_001441243.1 hypothetical protein (macronuclear) [Paramecium tetraurelia strain d4-2]